MTTFYASIGGQLIPGTPAANPLGFLPSGGPGFGGLGGLGGGGPVSASVGQAGTIGRLSVPPSWAGGASEVGPSPGMAPFSSISAAPEGGPGGLLRGIPLAGAGRRASGGFTHRYGFRYSVMPRPPFAG
ncbi:MAG: PE/PPE C-terminal domain-containing protein [Mycobacterium sp.]